MKLTAKRIAKLRKKIRRYRLYSYDYPWPLKVGPDVRYTKLYGLNMGDAIKRYVKKINRDKPWNEKPYGLTKTWCKNFADYACVPEGVKSYDQICWFEYT